MRAEIRGLIVRDGMPAFWLIINPSDLQNLLVLVLAGALHSSSALPNATATVCCTVAVLDPVAVARFFHHTCTAVLDGLLRSKPSEFGILGDVSNYFGVVETNGRGMLHLHALIWVRGNLDFMHLRDRIWIDDNFARCMLLYLEKIIVQSLYEADPDNPDTVILSASPSSSGPETDAEYLQKVFDDGNHVAQIKQLHSKRHSTTCFKSSQQGSNRDSCCFGMPCDLVNASKVDEHGIIHLLRNHAWVTLWNPSITSCIRSNYDISWIPTISKSLALLYYITNYATKDDVSPWQMVAKAALLKQAIDHANSLDSLTTVNL